MVVQVRCVNHFARNDDDHVQVGTTSRGTVVRLDKRFVDAEIRIATGLVEPHFMAGYSGALTLAHVQVNTARSSEAAVCCRWVLLWRLPSTYLCRRPESNLTWDCPRRDHYNVSLCSFYGGSQSRRG